MRLLRDILIALLILGLLAGAGALYLFYRVHRAGGSELETWIGRQVIGVFEAHLTPRVGFRSLDYRAPYTVVVEDLTLTAEGRPIASIRRLLLELQQTPRLNQPIQIARIEMDQPKFQFLRDPDRGFIGWTNLVRQDVRANLNSAPPGRRLSDVLVLQHVEIRDGEVVYAVLDGSDPMTLPGITLTMNIPRPSREPGWHEIKGTFKRDPLFTVELDGRLNVDSMLADLRSFRIDAILGPDQYGTLPPAIQKPLREHEITGRLAARLSGQVPLSEPLKSQVGLDLDLQNASMISGKSILPVQRFALRSTLANAVLSAAYEADLLQGTIRGDASMTMTQQLAVKLTWNAENIEMADTLRSMQQGQPEYAGRIKAQGQFGAMLGNLPASISGGGKLSIDRGKLVNLPLIKELVAVVAKIRLGVLVSPQDTAEFVYELRPDHVYLSKLEIVSALVGVRGKGQIFYDKRLNLDVQAGLLEKLQGNLGPIGDLLGAVKLVNYKVTGVVGDPKVTLNPLGVFK